MGDPEARLAILHLVKTLNAMVHLLFEFRRQWVRKGYDHDLLMSEHELSEALDSLTKALDLMVENEDDHG